ncbi:carbonic anhydrase 4-like isoform X3 [Anguilla rostrata]|uniref:carbonic anhydrase 4-like isoform X3 n=1 Tax=Anguilla rostrata TaxID=7938 RepID=UPI0030CACDB4
MHLLFLCLVSICFINITTGADWCYESQVSCNRSCLGPEEWNEVAASCEGRVQSPINIVTRKTLLDERLVPFTFSGYEEAFRSLLKNNGHTVEVDLPHSAMVSGGSLESTYRAVQLHLHWGQNGGSGSEHTIDGEQYPMELHIVHVKQEYSSLAEALEDPTGVAVLGFFFEAPTHLSMASPWICSSPQRRTCERTTGTRAPSPHRAAPRRWSGPCFNAPFPSARSSSPHFPLFGLVAVNQ